MKILLCWTLAAIVTLSVGLSIAQCAEKKNPDSGFARETLVGAWHMVWMEEQGADGTVTRITDAKGSLIYTRDGHMSVQVIVPYHGYFSFISTCFRCRTGNFSSFNLFTCDMFSQDVLL